MATSIRRRSGVRSRSAWGSTPQFSAQSGQTGWGRTTTSSRRTKARKTGSSHAGYGGATVPTAYKGCGSTFAAKVHSFKTLYNQTHGPAKAGRPTPTTLNTFANWINKGAIVQIVTTAQVGRWAKVTNKNFNSRTPTATACKNVLWAKFGKSPIKAVARTKSGSFMVVTSPTVNGRNFCFPK